MKIISLGLSQLFFATRIAPAVGTRSPVEKCVQCFGFLPSCSVPGSYTDASSRRERPSQ